MAASIELDEPANYDQVCKRTDKQLWLKAMQEETISLAKNKTWYLVERPKGARMIGSRWIFKKKPGILGVVQPRYKAGVVAKGYSQIQGFDYHEIFSPVVKHSSIRLILAIVAIFKLELEQLLKTTFLHGSLHEKIYMK